MYKTVWYVSTWLNSRWLQDCRTACTVWTALHHIVEMSKESVFLFCPPTGISKLVHIMLKCVLCGASLKLIFLIVLVKEGETKTGPVNSLPASCSISVFC